MNTNTIELNLNEMEMVSGGDRVLQVRNAGETGMLVGAGVGFVVGTCVYGPGAGLVVGVVGGLIGVCAGTIIGSFIY